MVPDLTVLGLLSNACVTTKQHGITPATMPMRCSALAFTVAKKTVYSPFVYRHLSRLLECLKSKFYSEKRSSVHVFAHIVVNPCLFIVLRHSLSQLYSVGSFLTYFKYFAMLELTSECFFKNK